MFPSTFFANVDSFNKALSISKVYNMGRFRIFLCHTHDLSYCACLTRETERKSVFRDICAMADVMESLEAMDMERFKLAVSKCSEHTRDMDPGSIRPIVFHCSPD